MYKRVVTYSRSMFSNLDCRIDGQVVSFMLKEYVENCFYFPDFDVHGYNCITKSILHKYICIFFDMLVYKIREYTFHH